MRGTSDELIASYLDEFFGIGWLETSIHASRGIGTHPGILSGMNQSF